MRLWYTWLAVNRSPPSSPSTTMTSRRIESRGGVGSAFYQVGDSEGAKRPRWFPGYLQRALDRGAYLSNQPLAARNSRRRGSSADSGGSQGPNRSRLHQLSSPSGANS